MSPGPRLTRTTMGTRPSGPSMRRPSQKTQRSTGRSGVMDSSTTSDGEVRNARARMVCGATGTLTMPLNSGVTMGPPAESA